MLKMRRLSETPFTMGMVARMMGTAPRRPAQESRVCSCQGMRKGARLTITLRGRATMVRIRPTSRAGTMSSPISCGVTSRPSRTNMPIWAIQPSPSAKPRVAGQCGSLALPSSMEAR